MMHSGASDLGLHCLPMFHKKDHRLIWVNPIGLRVIQTPKSFGCPQCNKVNFTI